jgi:hypothetical protein
MNKNLSLNERIDRFEKMTRWMLEDLERAMFLARANFLVAVGIVAYIETLGSFIFPKKISAKKGKIVDTDTGERFYAFYERLGLDYVLLKKKFWGRNKKKIYDDLRNGLLHEYLIKRKAFTVYGADSVMSEQAMLSCAKCGIAFDSKSNEWHLYNPRLYIDFKKAIEVYLVELRTQSNPSLMKNFDIRSREINMKFFI